MGVRLENLHDSLAFGQGPALLMLGAAVALLFLIVCANVAFFSWAAGQSGRASSPSGGRLGQVVGASFANC